MLRRILLRAISVLFAINAIFVVVFAFAMSSVISVPESVMDAVAPALIISVFPMVATGAGARVLLELLRLGELPSMVIAAVAVAALAAVTSIALWREKRWAIQFAGINVGAAGAIFAMGLGGLLLPDPCIMSWGMDPFETWKDVGTFGLVLAGMVACIWLGVYLMRAARAERGEYPTPEVGLSLRGK